MHVSYAFIILFERTCIFAYILRRIQMSLHSDTVYQAVSEDRAVSAFSYHIALHHGLSGIELILGQKSHNDVASCGKPFIIVVIEKFRHYRRIIRIGIGTVDSV